MQNGHAQCLEKNGFTIIELLVVIGIIGLLIAMLLPAVQAVRETARQMQCRNHVKQLAMAVLLHEQTHGHFPTGGWDWSWSGDPDRGFKQQQPGGWFYNILPYMEQQPLHDLGRGLKGDQKMAAQAQRIETLVTGGLCPSRRSEPIYPHHGPPQNGQVVNAGPYHVSSRIDYAINVGNVEDLECEEPRHQDPSRKHLPFRVCDTRRFDGVSYQQSLVRAREVTDGLSNTYLIGEKYLDAAEYLSGIDPGDNESPYCGVDADHYRSTSTEYPLIPDEPGRRNKQAFGSAHPGGFHMALGDGSVRFVRFDIAPDMHRRLGSRDDGQVVDLP